MHIEKSYRAAGGFSLIELMIVITAVGVLLAFAYPSYMDSVRKSRRVDAFATGYTNASWTLKAELTCRYVDRG